VTSVPETLFWWAACIGLWLLTLSSISTPDVVAATAAGLPCAVLAVAARRAVGGSWPPRPAWSRWLLPLPVAVGTDTVRVLGLAAAVLVGRRIPDGEVREAALHRDRAAGRRRTREAAAALLVTAAPGTLVLDADADEGRMLVHALGAGRPSMEEEVGR
jgi:multisubunit Na+/H+ antiporter MnhE subunit